MVCIGRMLKLIIYFKLKFYKLEIQSTMVVNLRFWAKRCSAWEVACSSERLSFLPPQNIISRHCPSRWFGKVWAGCDRISSLPIQSCLPGSNFKIGENAPHSHRVWISNCLAELSKGIKSKNMEDAFQYIQRQAQV